MSSGSQLEHLDGRLGDDEVHVWHTDPNVQEQSVQRQSLLLDADELDRASRFLVPAPRIQFVLSRAFLKTVLGCYLGISAREVQFRVGKHGKPELANCADLKFNLSHTDGATVIAV